MNNLIPDSSDDIIVGVLYDSVFNWYVTDKEIWYLDYQKRIEAFRKKGFEIEEYIDEIRKNLLVLNSNNAKQFLEKIKGYQVNTNKLRELLQESINANDDSWRYVFRPSLYIDFDSRKLFSLYSEPASYEKYAPKNWEAKYIDFMDDIPYDKKYWLSENGQNLLN